MKRLETIIDILFLATMVLLFIQAFAIGIMLIVGLP
jgi:hypothetical protein